MAATRTKRTAVYAALWSLPGVVFGLSMVFTANLWIAVGASLVGLVAARMILRRSIAALADDRTVVLTEHAVEGRIEAVEVFWRPGCPFHGGLDRVLASAGVPTNLRHIWDSPDDAAIVRSITGGDETVPTLIIGPVALVNPSEGLVMATLREHAPHLLDADHRPR